MRVAGFIAAACAGTLVACASAGEPALPVDAPPTSPVDSPPGASGDTCPAGELAVDVSSTGQVTCAPFDEPTRAAFDAGCSVYLGWRDNCDGCLTPPIKWGRSGATCANGVGLHNTCTTPTLGGTAIPMFGLNFDGDVDGNDKLYGTLHCAAPAPATTSAPCPAGHYITGTSGSGWTCSPLATAAVEHAKSSCSLYFGWRDNCNGCVTPPSKWGHAGDGSCQNGAGVANTCTSVSLGTETVNLFGLNPDGSVNDDDKFHIGLHCTTPAPAASTSTTACPPGQFVSGTATDGSFTCESPAPTFAEVFAQRCTIYFGWRDNCEGCTSPPTKWGLARVGACMLGLGASNTCGEFTLGQAVSMFGLNTDGDVDGNDTMYVGLRCL